MRFALILAPSAVAEYRGLSAFHRAQVRDAMDRHLRFEPLRVSRSRIKRLRGLRKPQYRLRVGGIRVFYDVTEGEVHVLAIVTKEAAGEWLQAEGLPHHEGGPGEGEG